MHKMTAGHEGSVGVRGDTPPRSRMTSSGAAVFPADSACSRPATLATILAEPRSLISSGFSSRRARDSACVAVASTSRRLLTTHQMRVGARRIAGLRSASDANHHSAISRQAVLPSPVGTPTSSGHRPSALTRLASRACQGKGSLSLIAR